MIGEVFAAIYAELDHVSVAAVAPGGVYRDRAPAATPFPYVVLAAPLPLDSTDVLAGEAFVTGDWTVKVVDESLSAKAADDAYTVVHGRLQDVNLSVTGYTTMVCRRRTIFSYDEDVEGGGSIQHVGATYRIAVT